MRKVAFYFVHAEPRELLGTVSLDADGKVVADGNDFVQDIAQQPVGCFDDDMVFPTDGMKFLEALVAGYQGSAVIAVWED